MKIQFILLFLTISLYSYCQDTLIQNFTGIWQNSEVIDNTNSYRKLWKIDDSTYGCIYHYKSGEIVVTNHYNLVDQEKKGGFKRYYKNGVLQQLGEYKDSLKTGIWVYYYQSGEVMDSSNYFEDEKTKKYVRYYESGQLKDEGTYAAGKQNGEWHFYSENAKLTGKILYQNGEELKVEYWDENGIPQTDNLVSEIMPAFPGEQNAMTMFIRQNVEYPEIAREMGEQGNVYIEFTVAKLTGELQDIKIVKGVSTSIDAEALRVIKNMPNWNPGIQYNRPVDVKFTMPIRFRLAGHTPKPKKKRNRFSR